MNTLKEETEPVGIGGTDTDGGRRTNDGGFRQRRLANRAAMMQGRGAKNRASRWGERGFWAGGKQGVWGFVNFFYYYDLGHLFLNF